MNTRRYPSTLAEAFPRTPRYACAVERPAPNHAYKLVKLAFKAACIWLACYYLWMVYA